MPSQLEKVGQAVDNQLAQDGKDNADRSKTMGQDLNYYHATMGLFLQGVKDYLANQPPPICIFVYPNPFIDQALGMTVDQLVGRIDRMTT